MPGRLCENASPREVMPWCRQQVTSLHRSVWDVPRCFLFLPYSSSSSSGSPGDIPFTLTLKSASRAPQIAQLRQESPCHWQFQPVSSEESLPCLLSGTHAPSGGVRTPLLPVWKCVVWEGVMWHGGDLGSKSSHVSGMGLGRGFSGACFLCLPLFFPRSNSSMFLQQALPSHVWYSEVINNFRMVTHFNSL